MSQGMIDVARKQVSDVPGISIEFVRANALNMPFVEEFDVAVCFGALGHILPADQHSFVKQVNRILKPGGKFLFMSSYMPPPWSRRHLVSRSFNAVMHVRNFFVRPPFHMYYLIFLLPEAAKLFEKDGFDVDIRRDAFNPPWKSLCLVIAKKPKRCGFTA